jgi:hypothetical protein
VVAGREVDMVDWGKSPPATDSYEISVFAIRRRKLTEQIAAWCVGNCATFALLCLQTYVCEDSVLDTLLSCVSMTPAERFRPLWVRNEAELYKHLKNLPIFLGTSESYFCKVINFIRLTNPMPPDIHNAGSQGSLRDWLCFRWAVHLQRLKLQG